MYFDLFECVKVFLYVFATYSMVLTDKHNHRFFFVGGGVGGWGMGVGITNTFEGTVTDSKFS